MSITSTLDAPLKFFQLYFLVNNVSIEFNKFIENYEGAGFEYNKELDIYYFHYYDEDTNQNCSDNLNVEFQNKITPIMESECLNTKGLLLDIHGKSVTGKVDNFKEFLSTGVELPINQMINSNIKDFIRFPCTLNPLLSIIEFANKTFHNELKENKLKIEASTLSAIVNSAKPLTDRIKYIVNYKTGLDKTGNEIYNPQDLNYLIGSIEYLLLNKELPICDRKIDFIPEGKELLRYTFYVLYKVFSKEYKIPKELWVKLLVKIFSEYEDTKRERISLSSNFSRRPSCYDDFIGDFISNFKSS